MIVRPMLAAAVLSAAVLPPSADGSWCPVPRATAGWAPMAVTGRTFADEPLQWVQPDPELPSRLFVGNGSEILRTRDFGCTWESVDDVSTFGGVASVVALRPTGNRTYLLTTSGSAVPVPRLLRADGDGDAFTPAAGALPPGTVGRESLAVSWRDPRRLYLVVRPALPGPEAVLLRSRDGGDTWETMPLGPRVAAAGTITGVVVDRSDPDRVYVWGPGTPVFRSTDGGAAFTSVSGTATARAGTSVALTLRGDVAFTDGRTLYAVSGSSARAVAAAPHSAVVAAGPLLTHLFVGTEAGTGAIGVRRFSRRAGRLVSATPGKGARGLVSDGVTFYAVDSTRLYRYTGPVT